MVRIMFVKTIFKDVTALGGPTLYLLTTIIAFFLNLNRLALLLILGFVISLLIVILVRSFYFKERPKKREHSNWLEKIDASAFPSLHSARIVLLSAIFIEFFSNNFITITLIITSLLVCYSRIYLKKHDWMDVGAGIVLGLIIYFPLTSFF